MNPATVLGARASRLLIAAVLAPLILGAHEDDWRKAAESHLRFARALAARGSRFDAALRARIIGDRIRGDCMPRPSRLQGLSRDDGALLKQYVLEVCAPKVEAWSEVFGECSDRVVTPRWCRSGSDRVIVEHVGLQAWFDVLGRALDSATSLERINVMGVVADFLNDDRLRHYPEKKLDDAVAALVARFLGLATSDEGFAMAEPILRSSFGSGDQAIEAFRVFRHGGSAFTSVQTCALDAMIGHQDPGSCPGYTPQVPTKSQAQLDEERRALQARATTGANLQRLKERVNAFYALQRDGDFNASYEFMAVDLREGGPDRASWVRTAKHLHETYPLVAWRMEPSLVVLGNIAEIRVAKTHRHLTGHLKGTEESHEGTEEYWYFENGTWDYGFGIMPDDWNGRPTAITLEEVQP